MAHIVVRGARTHNLKNVDVDIPRGALVVITGPSGSGKSSLAFSTIYAEGRRRYVESLSIYARQLLGPIARPDVERIEGLSPAIAIEQRSVSRNPRSTVGTITEIDDHLRLLFARAGVVHCPSCGRVVEARTVREIVDAILALGDGRRVSIMAPAVRSAKGSHAELLEQWRRDGFVRVRVDGALAELSDLGPLDPKKKHDVDLVIDRIALKEGIRARVLDAVELSLKRAGGMVRVVPADGDELLLSERFACVFCHLPLPPMEPALFSFNSPAGACPACDGVGVREVIDVSQIVPDPSLSLKQGAIAAFKKSLPRELESFARGVGIDLYAAWSTLAPRARDELLHGDGDSFAGALSLLDARLTRRSKDDDDDEPERGGRATVQARCETCGGARLRPEALSVTLDGRSIAALGAMSVEALRDVLAGLSFAPKVAAVVERVRAEILSRLGFLADVGLGYLTIARPAATLSGGEGQRVRLATQLGGALVGVLYVLDEPSVGLHPRDSERLLTTLRAMVSRQNTVLLVEHDLDAVRAADWVVDLGPGAGAQGGRVLASCTPEALVRSLESVTGPWLSGARAIAVPAKRRAPTGALKIVHARRNNLRGLSVEVPLGCLVAVTGVSGSGKSSLVLGTLTEWLRAKLAGGPAPAVDVDAIEGSHLIDRLVSVDASPLGRSSRSSPATYMGLFALLRELYATVPEARARGFRAQRFSYNVKGGRCESCQGEGALRVSMHFLPDVMVPCEACGGSRYEAETLAVRFRGHSIADVLAMTVDEAAQVFEAIPKVRDALYTLKDVGLGYLPLGQSATTLSGGEAQRVKLARELTRRSTGRTLYVLDEPTTGLHLTDIEVLLGLLERLVEQGNTVLVIEHHLDVIKRADRVIDIGPDGGALGGTLVATGTPEDIARCERSLTGAALRRTGFGAG